MAFSIRRSTSQRCGEVRSDCRKARPKCATDIPHSSAIVLSDRSSEPRLSFISSMARRCCQGASPSSLFYPQLAITLEHVGADGVENVVEEQAVERLPSFERGMQAEAEMTD